MIEKYKLYVDDLKKVSNTINTKYLFDENLNVKEVKNGIFLPPKKIADNNITGIYAGGVVESDGSFVAGLDRKIGRLDFNMACVDGYCFDKNKVKYRDEEVIFGGILLHIFGHVLIESMSRLWYVLENKNDKRKIVFLRYSEKCKPYDFFKLLGIEDRVVIVDEITSFKNIIVPDQSFVAWSGYSSKYISIFDEIKKDIKPYNYDKVYFTRTSLEKHDCVNEEYFEEFFKNNGYKIVSPEKISLAEQIAYLKGAKKFATTEGTLSHMALFCDDNIDITILKRTSSYMLKPQYMINEIKNLNVSLIDTTLNILPTTHYSNGIFLFVPNDNFKKYASDNNMKYNLDFDFYGSVVKYLNIYIDTYTKCGMYKKNCDLDYYDILKYIGNNVIYKDINARKNIYSGDISKNDLLKLSKKKHRRNRLQKIIIKFLKKLHLYDFVRSIYKKIKY